MKEKAFGVLNLPRWVFSHCEWSRLLLIFWRYLLREAACDQPTKKKSPISLFLCLTLALSLLNRQQRLSLYFFTAREQSLQRTRFELHFSVVSQVVWQGMDHTAQNHCMSTLISTAFLLLWFSARRKIWFSTLEQIWIPNVSLFLCWTHAH